MNPPSLVCPSASLLTLFFSHPFFLQCVLNRTPPAAAAAGRSGWKEEEARKDGQRERRNEGGQLTGGRTERNFRKRKVWQRCGPPAHVH
uniref:Secreted protein n=1 Tax=Globodera rostochiensis TaxID=31243 RepID=A0A914HIL4_GLORO